MRVALDTNKISDLFRGDAALAELLAGCEEIWVPLPVFAEYKAGILGGIHKRKSEAALLDFLSQPAVHLLLPGRETAEHYARIAAQLKTAGTPLPTNDMWIAALCVEHDLSLVTRDAHFNKIPQLIQV